MSTQLSLLRIEDDLNSVTANSLELYLGSGILTVCATLVRTGKQISPQTG